MTCFPSKGGKVLPSLPFCLFEIHDYGNLCRCGADETEICHFMLQTIIQVFRPTYPPMRSLPIQKGIIQRMKPWPSPRPGSQGQGRGLTRFTVQRKTGKPLTARGVEPLSRPVSTPATPLHHDGFQAVKLRRIGRGGVTLPGGAVAGSFRNGRPYGGSGGMNLCGAGDRGLRNTPMRKGKPTRSSPVERPVLGGIAHRELHIDFEVDFTRAIPARCLKQYDPKESFYLWDRISPEVR